MKHNCIIILLFVVSILINSSAQANVKLPALVGDNMVLQRDAKINLWGWADPGEKVSIQFQGKQLTTKTGKDGKWTLDLPPISAGGPYEMVIQGKNTITLKNILVGDVWIASGQSNMEFKLNEVNKPEKEIESADNSQIHLFKVEHKSSFQPSNDVNSSGWQDCTPELAAGFSAIAFMYGRELNKKYQVPIGLIQSSWGGTPAEAWTSAEGLTSIDFIKDKVNVISKLNNEKYESYENEREEWLKQHGKDDRGVIVGGKSWADVGIDVSDWSPLNFPGYWTNSEKSKGYGGTVWVRKEIDIPREESGLPLELHLATIMFSDSTFFNGEPVGSGNGYNVERIYSVPGNLVKPWKNVIAVQIKGMQAFGGGFRGMAENMYVQLANEQIPLAGEWLFKTGPDISDLPFIPALVGYNLIQPNIPNVIYNGMIAPLVPYSIKGVIWYQGESNSDDFEEARNYYSLFPALINDWRKQWGYNFPFLFVQLAGYGHDLQEPADYPWPHTREAQYKALSLPGTGMAVAIDLGEEDNIHPKNKQDVAKRLLQAARKVAYNENIVFSGPTFKSMNVEGNKIRLSFDYTGSGFLVQEKYGYVKGFAIAGADQKFVWAKAYLDGNDIIVSSDSIKNPVAVRYNWGNTPDGNLYNKENLPVVPFRTDTW